MLVSAILGVGGSRARAADYYEWYGADNQAGGDNTWNTASLYWRLSGASVAWPNGSATNAWAVLAGTVGAPFTLTVNSGTTINTNGLWFRSQYTLARGNNSSRLNFVGIDPTIRINSGVTSLIDVVMIGTNGLTITGGGNLTLARGATYTGTTTIDGATLTWGTSNALGSGAVTLRNAGILALGNNDDTVGTVTLVGGSINGTGTLTTTGSFEMQSGTVNAVLAGNGRALNKTGAGTVVLNGNTTYTGATTVSDGILQLGTSNRIAAGSNLVVNGGAFALGGFNEGLGSVTLNGGSITGTGGVLTGTSYTVANGSISAALGGAGALTKTTGGTVWLSGANTYTGATAINAGTLHLTGSLGNSPITVANGATFGGNGTATGAITAMSGTLAPGDNGIGRLTTGAQTWNTSGRLNLEMNNATGIAGTGWDALTVNGALNISSTALLPFTVQLISLAGTVPGAALNFDNTQSYSWTIASATSIAGFAANQFTIDYSQFLNPLNGSFAVNQVGNNLNLIYSPIPEPRLYAALFGLGTLGFVGFRRWRTRAIPVAA